MTSECRLYLQDLIVGAVLRRSFVTIEQISHKAPMIYMYHYEIFTEPNSRNSGRLKTLYRIYV